MASAGLRGVCGVLLIAAGAAAQQADDAVAEIWPGGGAVTLVGAQIVQVPGGGPARVVIPSGPLAVHFAADAEGKPGSLQVDVPVGAVLRIAAPRAAAAADTVVEAGAVAFGETPVQSLGTQVRHLPATDPDYRVSVRGEAAGGAFGVVARWDGPERHYRCGLDPATGEVRLERQLGNHLLGLGTAMVAPGQAHELTLQVRGFRLQVWVDDEVVLQALDGAHGRGGPGLWTANGAPRALRLGPVALPRPSLALVAEPGRATLVADTAGTPGARFQVGVRLDRPHPLVPRDADGREPWLRQRPAAPDVFDLGRGEVDERGHLRWQWQWPTLPRLAGRGGLLWVTVWSADGDRAERTLPAVPWRF